MTGFEPGLLDKLFDDDRRGPASPMLRNFSLEDMKNVVARDLEALLNTRTVFTDEMLAGLDECKRSVMTYGLHDFSGRSLASFDDRSFICRSLEDAIDRHEARLRNVVVTLELESQASTSVLYFNISALLTLPELKEPVNFDALLQPSTHQYSVTRGAGKARSN